MRSASTSTTPPNTFQARTSAPQTNTHPYGQKSTSSTTTSMSFHTPVGIYPADRPSATTLATPHEPVARPLSSDGLRQFLVPKPAIPTAPKPDFRRSKSVQPERRPLMISSPPSPPLLNRPAATYQGTTDLRPPAPARGSSVPPTTNLLNSQERADLIRKSRKLTQLFGQTPSPISGPGSLSDSQVPNNMLLPIVPPRRLHTRGARYAFSQSFSTPFNSRLMSPIHSEYQRRTMSPDRLDSFSPLRVRHSKYEDDDSDDAASPLDSPDVVNTPMSTSRKGNVRNAIRSPTIVGGRDSFMDMSDYDVKGSSIGRI